MNLSNTLRNTTFLLRGMFIASAVALIFLNDKALLNGALENWLGKEPFKLVIQFLLITVLGGALFALLNAQKEEQARLLTQQKDDEARRSTKIASLQALDEELAKAYRLMKSSKRRLRSRVDRTDEKRPRIDKDEFEKCMDQFLAAQLTVEEIQDRIVIRRDLFDETVMKRIDKTLRYAARYLHDVFEDFEKQRVTRDQDAYVIESEKAKNLTDFLFGSKRSEEVEAERVILDDETQSHQDRLAALLRIDAVRIKAVPDGQRYRYIAYPALRLASSELKHMIDVELR